MAARAASGRSGEAYAFLVGAPVFKTGEGRHPVLAGSIPVRLRSHLRGPEMSLDAAFFTATSDAEAARAEDRPGGPLGWPAVAGHRRTGLLRREPVRVELGPAYEGFGSQGYDPVVDMGTLEELLTGVDYDTVVQAARAGSPLSDADPSQEHGVLTLTDTLRDALTGMSEARLVEVVTAWSSTAELRASGASVEEHAGFVRELRALAVMAAAKEQHLYCYVTA